MAGLCRIQRSHSVAEMLCHCKTLWQRRYNNYCEISIYFIHKYLFHNFVGMFLERWPTFHNVLGTLWERFVCHFEKYLYLFIQSSHFVRGICLAEVAHQISQWNGVGITFYYVNLFSKACPDMIYVDFTILQKGCHNIVNIITLNYVYEWLLSFSALFRFSYMILPHGHFNHQHMYMII